MVVYVLNKHNEALMPCSPRTARLLLKQGKAKVMSRTPFTIKLLYGSSSYKQPLILGIDTGSSKVGSAVYNSQTKQVIYSSEIEIRNDITTKMKQRKGFRTLRHYHKTRYRKPRFLNRKNSIKKNRLSPTLTSKINSHSKEIKFVRSILPINKLIIETATFDTHALVNPEVLTNKVLYQKGINYGYANTKAYVLHRDNYTCQYCRKKGGKLHVHHITYRKNGGSDHEQNLATVHKPCHVAIHDKDIILKQKGKSKGFVFHASQMNVIRSQLLKRFPEAVETFGFITKEHRFLHKLDKSHVNDAAMIASEGLEVKFNTKILYKKCVSDGEYKLRKGARSEQIMPVRKIQSFRKFDKVLYLNKEYFIRGRMSSGYATLMDIQGKEVKVKPMAKFTTMTRLQARKSWIMDYTLTPGFSQETSS